MAWRDLSSQVGALTITRQTERVFREQDAFVAQVTARGGRAPTVDFEHRQILLVSPGPRSSTGYRVEVVQVRERSGNLAVTIRERTPGVGQRVHPGVTFPYRLIVLPAGKDVYVEWRDR